MRDAKEVTRDLFDVAQGLAYGLSLREFETKVTAIIEADRREAQLAMLDEFARRYYVQGDHNTRPGDVLAELRSELRASLTPTPEAGHGG